MQTLFLDISNITNMKMTPKSADGSVFLQSKQGDVGRQFKAVIMDGEHAFPIPPGAQFSVWYSGPSGEGNYSSVGDRSAFSVDGNTVTVEMIAQMLKKPGSGTLCLVLNTAQGKQLGLWNVIYAVEHVAGMDSEPAEDYYTALSELARQAISAAAAFETDASLTVAGKAADAAAVGAGLAGKAPSGHGYGDEIAWLGFDKASWESTGKFQADLEAVFKAMPQGTCKQVQFVDTNLNTQKFVGTLWKYTGDYGVLTAMNYSGVKAIKTFYGGTWNPWEWENPPLAEGVEYRTTERHEGKVVYVTKLDLGALPASGNKTRGYVGGYGGDVVRWEAFVDSASGTRNVFPFFTISGELRAKIYFTEWNIVVTAFADSSSTTGTATVWYTKRTA